MYLNRNPNFTLNGCTSKGWIAAISAGETLKIRGENVLKLKTLNFRSFFDSIRFSDKIKPADEFPEYVASYKKTHSHNNCSADLLNCTEVHNVDYKQSRTTQ